MKRIRLSVQLLLHQKDVLEPKNSLGQEIPFEVGMGESVYEIAEKLKSQEIISSSDIFLTYVIYSGIDKTVQAGNYKLDPGMNIIEIAKQLQDATPTEVTFRIIPGWRLEEIAAALPTSGLEISTDEFLALAGQPDQFDLPQGWMHGISLEGFLLPEAYVIPRKASAYEMIDLLLSGIKNQLSQDMVEGFSDQGLDVYQAVILASIIQREAMVAEEFPLIASVFLNRFQAGMSLESDPTVQYALGYDQESNSWWKSPLSINDLGADSAYNTYAVNGLPPGPICNPSLAALSAVAHPAQTPYYYFRAKCDESGKHNFAVNFQEHINNSCP